MIYHFNGYFKKLRTLPPDLQKDLEADAVALLAQ
jgi:hypothetical protein